MKFQSGMQLAALKRTPEVIDSITGVGGGDCCTLEHRVKCG